MRVKKNSDTFLIHSGRNAGKKEGFVNSPVYRGSTILFPSFDEIEASLQDGYEGLNYGRYGSPTTIDLKESIAQLEGADHVALTSCGLSAITITLLGLLKAGDHMLVVDSAYVPVRKFVETYLPKFNIQTTYYDPSDIESLKSNIQENTRVIYTESPGSVTFEVQDIPLISSIAKEKDIIVVNDNTWATGFYHPVLDLGADVSLISSTKYIIGHSDAMIGLIASNKKAWPLIEESMKRIGEHVSSDDCYLALRGLRTLSVRLQKHYETSLSLIDWLKKQPEVDKVFYPADPEFDGYELWKRDFSGASGLFSFALKPCPRKAVSELVDHLSLFGIGFSWGGFESLILPSYPHTYRSFWKDTSPIFRVHTGLEEPQDLIDDLSAGFDRMRACLNK